MLIRIAALLIAGGLGSLAGIKAWAEVPDALEPKYSEAVIAYNQKDYGLTVKILDGLIGQNPEVVEFYSLKGLTFKTEGKLPQAVKAYSDTISQAMKAKRPAQELAGYYFELGVLMNQLKQYDRSNQYLAYAVKMDFNAAAASMYMGLNAFAVEHWDIAAEQFNSAASLGNRDISPSAYLYLGQTYLKTRYSVGATSAFLKAKKISQATIDDPDASAVSKELAAQTLESANAALKPYESSQYFATLATLSLFDSNVLAVPSSVDSSAVAGGKSSATQTLSAGIGYMTSALDTVQFVPTYKAGYNYNFNQNARSAEFVTNSFALYSTLGALEITHFGLRTEFNFNFRNEVDANTDSGTYRKFFKNFAISPYFKTEVSPRHVVGGDISLEPTTYYQDAYVAADSARTGTYFNGSLYYSNDTGRQYYNPLVKFKLVRENTQGTEYRSWTKKLILADTLHLNSKLDVSPQLSYALSTYSDRSSGERDDKVLDAQVQGVYSWTDRWTIITTSSLTINNSNVASTYQYTRFVIGGGLSYKLF